MKKTVLTFLTIVCLISAVFLTGLSSNIQTAKANPTTWTVDDDGPADFSSIQAAIDSPLVMDGDMIYVHNGIYQENVVVDRPVSLVGENKHNTIIDGNGAGSVIFVTTNNINITGLTVQNSGAGFMVSGIYLKDSDHNNIEHNIVENNRFGILAEYCESNNFGGNVVSNNSHGIQLGYSTKNLLIENNASGNSAGVLLHEADSNILAENAVTNNNFGVVVGNSSDNIVKNNVFSGSVWAGIRILEQSDGNILINNTALNNLDGFELTYANGNTLINNIASHNRRIGIGIGYSNHNTLTGNRILSNNCGIEVQSSSGDNIIHHNNFINNTKQAYILLNPVNTEWDDGYPSGGNYWSDYSGVDLYSGIFQNETGYDWIGDQPYVIDENNIDNYPLADPSVPEREETRVAYRDSLSNFNSLNSTYYELFDDYGSLQGKYDSLNSTYNALGTSYDQLQSYYEATINELNNMGNLMYVFITTTIILIATTIHLALRKPKIKP